MVQHVVYEYDRAYCPIPLRPRGICSPPESGTTKYELAQYELKLDPQLVRLQLVSGLSSKGCGMRLRPMTYRIGGWADPTGPAQNTS